MERKTALVTGASAGIGMELARVHARNGHNLVLVARSEEALQNLKKELEETNGVSVRVISADLAVEGAARRVYDELKSEGIEIEYLINNAGIGEFGLYHKSDWKQQAVMLDLNIKALAHLTRLFSADMADRGSGRIMNVASTAAFQPGPLMSIYYASKHFVLAFSEAIAQELHDYGVRVTALCPGPTQSNFHSRADMENSGLVSLFKMPSSRAVAEYGFRAMMKGKRVAVHGVMNKLLAQLTRFAPRRLSTAVVRWINKTR